MTKKGHFAGKIELFSKKVSFGNFPGKISGNGIKITFGPPQT